MKDSTDATGDVGKGAGLGDSNDGKFMKSPISNKAIEGFPAGIALTSAEANEKVSGWTGRMSGLRIGEEESVVFRGLANFDGASSYHSP